MILTHIDLVTPFLDVKFVSFPLTFVCVPGFQQLWDNPHRKESGVYLWCIEYENAYLVNYVGQSTGQGGFGGRIGDEFRDWRAGLYWTPVDIEPFKTGLRIPLKNPAPDHLGREIAELAPIYRILLIPVRGGYECCQVEDTIVDLLRKHKATYQFLANGDKDWKYRPAPTPQVRFGESPRIIGLTDQIPESLNRLVQ